MTGPSERQASRIWQQAGLYKANHPEETRPPASQPDTETIALTETERAAISRSARNTLARTIESRCAGQLNCPHLVFHPPLCNGHAGEDPKIGNG